MAGATSGRLEILGPLWQSLLVALLQQRYGGKLLPPGGGPQDPNRSKSHNSFSHPRKMDEASHLEPKI